MRVELDATLVLTKDRKSANLLEKHRELALNLCIRHLLDLLLRADDHLVLF